MKKFAYGLKRNNRAVNVLGIMMALVSLILWSLWFSTSMTILLLTLFFAVLFLAFGFFRITANTERAANVINYIWGLAAIAVVIGASLPTEYTSNIVFKILLNYLCAMFLVEIVFVITANWKISVNVSICILMLLIVVNTVVLNFRGKELGPADILSVKTALSVAGQYKFQMTRRLLLTCLAFLWLCSVSFLYPQCRNRKIPRFIYDWVRWAQS